MNHPQTLPQNVQENSSEKRIVLASGSPRRRELLTQVGLPFTVRAADLDETPLPTESPSDYVLRLAIEKALAVARPGELVLAADTTIAFANEILGKPTDSDDAKSMLQRLAGTAHEVHTGMALVDGDDLTVQHAVVDTATVAMRTYDEALIDWYVATEEPFDKAGSYAIQGVGAILVERIEGNVQTVIGLNMSIIASWFATHFDVNN